ncbi:hypothetical protein PG991_001331 [Apiospora marii]|uniref:Uncharacterized protein n=1 Tax=Apiospora marii TaxID=335849 RepID=A0ABR1SRS6_9PEZI
MQANLSPPQSPPPLSSSSPVPAAGARGTGTRSNRHFVAPSSLVSSLETGTSRLKNNVVVEACGALELVTKFQNRFGCLVIPGAAPGGSHCLSTLCHEVAGNPPASGPVQIFG